MSTDEFYKLFTETGEPMYWLMSRETQSESAKDDTTMSENEADSE